MPSRSPASSARSAPAAPDACAAPPTEAARYRLRSVYEGERIYLEDVWLRRGGLGVCEFGVFARWTSDPQRAWTTDRDAVAKMYRAFSPGEPDLRIVRVGGGR